MKQLRLPVARSKPRKISHWITPSVDELRARAKERAIYAVYDIAMKFSDRRDGEDVLVEALRRWRDKDVF